MGSITKGDRAARLKGIPPMGDDGKGMGRMGGNSMFSLEHGLDVGTDTIAGHSAYMVRSLPAKSLISKGF